MFLKECKYIQKENKVIRYVIDDLESSFDDSDEEQIKAKYEKVFLGKQLWKWPFWGNNFENVLFQGAISRIYLWMEQLKCIFRESNSKNEAAFMKMSFFEGVILKIFLRGGNFENIFSESIFESISFCESNFDK